MSPVLVSSVAAALIGEEELDRLAEPARDVLQRREGRPRPTGFDKVDGRSCHTAVTDLGQAEAGLHAGLLDRPGPEIDSREAPAPGTVVSAVPIGYDLAPADAGLDHAGSLAEIT